MTRPQKWYAIFAVLTSIALLGGTTIAVASSDAPTKAEAQAALDHIDQDQQVIQDYLDSLESTPTPTPTPTTPEPTVEPTVVPTTPGDEPTPTPTGSPGSGGAVTWNSGVWARHSAADATAFETMRGKTLGNVAVFTSRSSWNDQLNTWWLSSVPAGSTANLSVGIPLWPTGNSVTNTGTDAQWAELANKIEAKDPTAFIRLGWEMNLNNSWAMTNANKTQWQASFIRAADLIQGACPGCRIIWNPNKGADQSCTNCSQAVFQAVKDRVWSYGIDSYDSYPPANTTANIATQIGYLNSALAVAKAAGKPFSLPEWGVACNVATACQWKGNAGGDNPQYITAYMNWMKANAADMGMDSYFNESAAYLVSDLLDNNPNSRAAYAAAF